MVNVHALGATGVNAEGHREILRLQVTSDEDGTGWLSFLAGPDCPWPSNMSAALRVRWGQLPPA